MGRKKKQNIQDTVSELILKSDQRELEDMQKEQNMNEVKYESDLKPKAYFKRLLDG